MCAACTEVNSENFPAACPLPGMAADFTSRKSTDKNIMKKAVVSLLLLSALGLTSCQPSVAMVPPNTRPVIGPEGSAGDVKSWSRVTEQEGNAVLGPLSNMRR